MLRPIFKPLTVLLVAILLVSCAPTFTPTTRPPPTQTAPPPSPSPTPQIVPSPTPSPAPADLRLDEVYIEKNNDPYYNYRIVATIVNEGGTASGFYAGCAYKCPPGELTISAGIEIVQGGYIEGGGRCSITNA